MKQTALRPKPKPKPGQDPKPGQEPEPGGRPPSTSRRPHAAPRRARQRLTALLFALSVGAILVLSGVGLGTMGATVIAMSKSAELRARPQAAPSVSKSPLSRGSSGPEATRPFRADTRPVGRPALGVEVVDAPGGGGALVVGVHVPGPGYTAGLVRGDAVLALDGTRVGSAADLARVVAAARPGRAVALAVRHANGSRQRLTAIPGVVL
ncbi:hypothetical protein SGFS_033680 [Streptomyces graminofaciens]|uniref:PDZ domain-containing protein n=1 Tax=Streptomyces graminofaciens TaxID=68212 RepID=A0ABM7F835_9ACTN|nr:PDZ domain-containing protein [Streptomyces graminofaciens]BBC32074.1 hypothetical protein SGFS_033680 [Streptomyces graminofaciens]